MDEFDRLIGTQTPVHNSKWCMMIATKNGYPALAPNTRFFIAIHIRQMLIPLF